VRWVLHRAAMRLLTLAPSPGLEPQLQLQATPALADLRAQHALTDYPCLAQGAPPALPGPRRRLSQRGQRALAIDIAMPKAHHRRARLQ